jgi:hypothetical protein
VLHAQLTAQARARSQAGLARAQCSPGRAAFGSCRAAGLLAWPKAHGLHGHLYAVGGDGPRDPVLDLHADKRWVGREHVRVVRHHHPNQRQWRRRCCPAGPPCRCYTPFPSHPARGTGTARNVICRFVDNLTSHHTVGPTPFLLLPGALEAAGRPGEVGPRGGGEGRGAA